MFMYVMRGACWRDLTCTGRWHFCRRGTRSAQQLTSSPSNTVKPRKSCVYLCCVNRLNIKLLKHCKHVLWIPYVRGQTWPGKGPPSAKSMEFTVHSPRIADNNLWLLGVSSRLDIFCAIFGRLFYHLHAQTNVSTLLDTNGFGLRFNNQNDLPFKHQIHVNCK